MLRIPLIPVHLQSHEINSGLCKNLQIYIGQHCTYLSLVQGKTSVSRQSPRKENKQNLEILATVKDIIEHHRKMITAETVKVKLYSAHFSSAKSHRAEKHLLAQPHTDS